MNYDARIILGGRSPDIVNALARGDAARQQRLDFDNQNAMRDMLRTQGAGIMAGDQQALNALAQFDPSAALGIQGQRLDMDLTRKRMSVLDDEQRRSAEAYAKGLTAEQRAAEAAQLEAAIKQALAAPTPEAFDAMMIEMGRQDMVGQFANRQALAAPYMEIKDILTMVTPEPVDPTKGAPSGYMFTDPSNPAAGVTPLPGYSKTPGVVVNTGNTGGPQTEIGTIPQGYAAVVDANSPAGYRMVPIPGGPEDRTKTDAQAASNASIASDTVVTATKRALEAAGDQMFGAPGTSLVAALPVVGAASASGEKVRQTEVLKAQAIVSNLQAMRDASPTGGALGAVTKPELDMLAAKSGALDPNSPTYERDVLDYTRTLLRVVHGEAAGDAIFAQEFGGALPVATPGTPAAPKGPVVVDGFTIEAIE
jgi:hypothetical protein